MKKINLTTQLIFAFMFILSIATWADESATMPIQKSTINATEAAPAVQNWKAGLMSYYYDLKGKKAADNQEYDFNNLSTRIDLLNLSYTVSPKWTLSLLLQHYEFYTESVFPKLQNTPYANSFDRTEGAGDSFLTAVTPIMFQNSWLLIGDFGLSIPTGTINNKSNLPGLQEINLAYNAQHSSGTYDILGGITALYMQPATQFGTRLSANIRTGRNSNDYTLGNMYRLDSWLDFSTNVGLTPRVVGFYRYKEAIHNFDKTRGEILGDEFYRHSQKNWDISAALKYQLPIAKTGITLAAEAGIPMAQDSDNVDHSKVVTNYYGAFMVNGSF
ncbi:MAG: hypothetical protein WA160_00335 [Pseudobdellovibrio sp.]